jgi:hypothetical protein
MPYNRVIRPGQNLLILAQRQFMICESLSGVFSAQAGAGGIEDFGTAANPTQNFLFA